MWLHVSSNGLVSVPFLSCFYDLPELKIYNFTVKMFSPAMVISCIISKVSVILITSSCIIELVDSICRDGADTPIKP